MNVKNFRIIALVEASSFLVLIVAAVLKRLPGVEWHTGVEVMGPIHGALFVLYVFMALIVRIQTRWNLKQTVLILAGAVVPLGGYFVDRWVTRNERDRVHGSNAPLV